MTRNWIEEEINLELNLTTEQASVLDLHSFLNIISILIAESDYLQELIPETCPMEAFINRCESFRKSLFKPECVHQEITLLPEIIAMLESTIARIYTTIPFDHAQANTIHYVLENLQSVGVILKVRYNELMARIKKPNEWISVHINDITSSLVQFLDAMQKNSRSRFGFVYNIARQTLSDYMINLSAESDGDINIFMPNPFIDVIRDLIANARKYTEPSGKILLGIHNTNNTLKMVIEDTGRGIPADQIQTVVGFGYRAANVTDIKTRGAGFGLTKAYFITKRHQGRMWIASQLNHGTRIRIEIPHPNS
jgi:signal transduction histidine kinase